MRLLASAHQLMGNPGTNPSRGTGRLQEAGLLLVIFVLGTLLAIFGGSVEMPKIEVPTTAAPSAGASGNVEEARAWIQAWKDKTGDVLPPTPIPAAPTPTPAASIPASDAPNEEVRAWISAWRERTNK